MRVSSRIVLIAATAGITLSCSSGLEPPDQLGDTPADSTSVVPPRLDVLVTVAGPPFDRSGYSVVVSMTGFPKRVSPLGVRGGDAHFADLPPGTHAVELKSAFAVCTLAGENPRPFTATPGEITTVTFAVTCTAPVDSLPPDSLPSDSLAADSITVWGTWTEMAPMPGARSQPAAAALDGIVYVAGGVVDHSIDWEPDIEYPADILAYDPTKDVWQTVGQLAIPARAPAMAALNGRLYVIGGCHEYPFEPIADVQIFDPGTGQVETGPSLPYGLCGSSAVVLDGRIHVIGGAYIWDSTDPLFGDAPSSAHLVFDPSTGTWSELAPLPIARTRHAAVVLDGAIYVVGALGYLVGNPDSAVQVYDPSTDSWTAQEASSARFGIAAVELSGMMYVFGGSEGQATCCGEAATTRAVDRFAPATGRWAGVIPMTKARTGAAAVVVGTFVYVIGGSPTDNWLSALASVERFLPDNP